MKDIQPGDYVTLRNNADKRAWGIGNCKVVSVGKVDVTPAATILIGGNEYIVATENCFKQAGYI